MNRSRFHFVVTVITWIYAVFSVVAHLPDLFYCDFSGASRPFLLPYGSFVAGKIWPWFFFIVLVLNIVDVIKMKKVSKALVVILLLTIIFSSECSFWG